MKLLWVFSSRLSWFLFAAYCIVFSWSYPSSIHSDNFWSGSYFQSTESMRFCSCSILKFFIDSFPMILACAWHIVFSFRDQLTYLIRFDVRLIFTTTSIFGLTMFSIEISEIQIICENFSVPWLQILMCVWNSFHQGSWIVFAKFMIKITLLIVSFYLRKSDRIDTTFSYFLFAIDNFLLSLSFPIVMNFSLLLSRVSLCFCSF